MSCQGPAIGQHIAAPPRPHSYGLSTTLAQRPLTPRQTPSEAATSRRATIPYIPTVATRSCVAGRICVRWRRRGPSTRPDELQTGARPPRVQSCSHGSQPNDREDHQSMDRVSPNQRYRVYPSLQEVVRKRLWRLSWWRRVTQPVPDRPTSPDTGSLPSSLSTLKSKRLECRTLDVLKVERQACPRRSRTPRMSYAFFLALPGIGN